MTLQDEIIDAIQNNELDDAFHKIQEYEQSYGHDDFTIFPSRISYYFRECTKMS